MESNGAARNGQARTSPADRLPPQNIEAEEGVLGAILIDNECIDEILPILKAEHFYRDSHQIIYRAIGELHTAQIPVDSILLEERLRTTGELDRIGGLDAILLIMGSTPHSANVRYHAQIVLEKALARDLAFKANSILDAVYSDNFSAEDLLAAATAGIAEVADTQEVDDKVFTSEQTAAKYLKTLARRETGRGSGRLTGIELLDNHIVGMQGGQLIVLGAPPSVGKTALAVQIARFNAMDAQGRDGEIIQEGVQVFYCTLEMSDEELFERSIITLSGIDGGMLKRGAIVPDHDFRGFLEDAIKAMSKTRMHTFDTGIMTVDAIRPRAARIQKKGGLGLIVTDHLHLMSANAGGREKDEVNKLAEITKGLKALARDLNVPVLLLSQFNRDIGKRPDKVPVMGDLRGSGAIEQDADVVILMHRPSYWEKDSPSGVIDLHLVKNRNGPIGLCELSCDLSKGWFGPRNMHCTRLGHVPDLDNSVNFRDYQQKDRDEETPF